jgi:hypothetical protein
LLELVIDTVSAIFTDGSTMVNVKECGLNALERSDAQLAATASKWCHHGMWG